MARRRMFSLDVVDTDKFACMSKDARYLYFELGVRADDDGFIGSPMRIIKMTESTKENLNELINTGFIIQFDTGIIVITDWLQNNQLRKDRYKPTVYVNERNQISIDESAKKYVLNGNQMETNGLPSDTPDVNQMEANGLRNKLNSIEKESNNKFSGKPNGNQRFPQDRLGKNSIDKDSINNNCAESDCPQDAEEVIEMYHTYCPSLTKAPEFEEIINHSDGKYKGLYEKLNNVIAINNPAITTNEFKTVFINGNGQFKEAVTKGTKKKGYLCELEFLLESIANSRKEKATA